MTQYDIDKKKAQEISKIVNDPKAIQDKIIKDIINDFRNLGWNSYWDDSIHHAEGQLDRLERAVALDSIRLIKYSEHSGYAKILGTKRAYYLVNQYRCSCPDFRKRRMPCKHIYFLALTIPNYQEHLFNDHMSHSGEDDTLYGLTFNVTGNKQKAVKEFIVHHGGQFEDLNVLRTTAVVTSDDQLTERVLSAKSSDIEIFTFEEFQKIFDYKLNGTMCK